MRRNKRPSRLGTIAPVVVEDAIKERRERVIDLSKYNVGFEAVTNKKARPTAPSTSKAVGVQYQAYLKKFEKGARKRVILDKEIKSIILTEKNGLREIFYSPISSTTLAKRAGRMELE